MFSKFISAGTPLPPRVLANQRCNLAMSHPWCSQLRICAIWPNTTKLWKQVILVIFMFPQLNMSLSFWCNGLEIKNVQSAATCWHICRWLYWHFCYLLACFLLQLRWAWHNSWVYFVLEKVFFYDCYEECLKRTPNNICNWLTPYFQVVWLHLF